MFQWKPGETGKEKQNENDNFRSRNQKLSPIRIMIRVNNSSDKLNNYI